MNKNVVKFYLTSVLLALSMLSFSQAINTGMIRVSQQHLESRIFELAKFGKDSLGRGYRLAYTKGDQQARAWYMELLKNAGLAVNIDAAGNIIGRRKGKNPALKPIAFGSHIDMVPDGGNYDGDLGSLGALEVIEIFNENSIITNHPLEVIVFSNEEGVTIGSTAMAGHLMPEALQLVAQSGLTQTAGIKAIGGNPDSIQTAARRKGDLSAFLELHIEQGGILDSRKVNIGIVEGIVGIEHWDVVIEGFANHAGTTPMNMRHDALLAAAKFIVAVNETVTGYDGRQVGTVGKISAAPGAYNVIPGKVTTVLELRDLSFDKIGRIFHAIEKKAAAIGTASGTKISFIHQPNPPLPALTDRYLQDKIITAAKALGLSYQYIQSGAGHDSQEMALIAPVAMIFVPSVDGISHSPKEFTKASDMANGVNVLLQTVLLLDKE